MARLTFGGTWIRIVGFICVLYFMGLGLFSLRSNWGFLVIVAIGFGLFWFARKLAGLNAPIPTMNLGPAKRVAVSPPPNQYSPDWRSPAPRDWDRVLTLSTPRAVSFARDAVIQALFIVTFSGIIVFGVLAQDWLPLKAGSVRPRLFTIFILGLAIILDVATLRTFLRDRSLLREGNVCVGWITDRWEAGKHQTNWITVEFEDAMGRKVVKDIALLKRADISGPGDPVLVFYKPSNPERCTTPSAAWFELVVPGGIASDRRWG